jgi:hypothetical protein
MRETLLEILNSSDPSINPIHRSWSSIDIYENVDSIYNIQPINTNSNTYIVDKMIITRDQLSSIKLNQLSEFMRSEILQYNLGNWNKQSPSTILVNLPISELKCTVGSTDGNCLYCNQISSQINKLNDISLDKITFQIKESGPLSNKKYNLKDYWPLNGADLAIKAEEGTRIRSILGLESEQEIKILSLNKPTPDSSQTSLVTSMNDSELFYRSSNGSKDSSLTTLHSAEIKPNTFTVEEYHAYLDYIKNKKPLPQEPLLENEVFPRRFQNTYRLFRIRGDIWAHSTIYEGSSESLLPSNNRVSTSRSTILSNSTGSLVNYSFPQNTNTEFRNAILDMMNEIDNDLDFLNNRNITRTNTGESTLVNSTSNSIEEISSTSSSTSSHNEAGLLDRNNIVTSADLGYHYRSTSPLSIIRTTSPVTSGSNTIRTSPNLEHNLANDVD